MDTKKILLITLIAVAVISSVSAVSAGLFDSNEDANADIKTHEFNYINKVTFNISDELTNNTSVKDIFFGDGVSYKTPKNEKGEYSILRFEGVDYYRDPVESNKNDAAFEDLGKNQTSQGYDAYTFKWAQSDMYEVYIDLDNMTIVGSDDYEAHYHYFKGTFTSPEEAQIFIETFKVNKDVNGGV